MHMEEKYYFVIGERNIVVAETIKVLESCGAAFRLLEKPYIFTRDEEEKLLEQGFKPVYIGVSYRSDTAEYNRVEDSVLYKALQYAKKEFSINDWQYMVMEYYLGRFHLDWSCNLRKLIAAGNSRKEIVKLQRQNREAIGFDEEAEKSAQVAVDEALNTAGRRNDFLVIKWNYQTEDSDFENWLPILDRVFWIQNFVNVLIITPYNAAYYGYGSIAFQIIACCNSTGCASGNLAEFLYPLSKDDILRTIRFLKKESSTLRKEGLLW